MASPSGLIFSNNLVFARSFLANVTICPTEQESGERLSRLLAKRGINKNIGDKIVLDRPSEGEKITVNGLLRDLSHEHPEIFENVEPNGDPVKKEFMLNYEATGKECYVVNKDKPIRVSHIVFDATVSVKTVPYSQIRQYSIVEGNAIAQAVNYVVNFGNTFVELTFLRAIAILNHF